MQIDKQTRTTQIGWSSEQTVVIVHEKQYIRQSSYESTVQNVVYLQIYCMFSDMSELRTNK